MVFFQNGRFGLDWNLCKTASLSGITKMGISRLRNLRNQRNLLKNT